VTGQASRGCRCIVCESERVEEFLDLGNTALANKFLRPDELEAPEPRYPLRVGLCHGCGHVQLIDPVPPSAMFEDYLYMSSASDTLKGHFDDLSRLLVERHKLQTDDLVIDIGANDASLLSAFRRHGVRTLGVDPARNLASLSADRGVERFTGFFGASTAPEIVARWGRAAIITATNTFPHIPELRDFVTGIHTALAPRGAFVIEAHYLVDMLDQTAFDTIYHEHVSYWALTPMRQLFARMGMEVVRAERLPIHHGQLRVWVQRKGEGDVDETVAAILENERRLGIGQLDTYQAFGDRVRQIKRDLQSTLTRLKREGKRVVGYGAPAKGSTLLEFLQIGPDLVEYIADRSALKQGRYTPGSHIPIVSPERLLADRPDYTLLLAWNFADEVLRQQAPYREKGGKFIVPVPEVKVL
jgi:C-methyltransferase C-terminal domain/Putative zinc binding domain/Methyltransferase domain